jgi:hypothetical protein
MIEPHRVPKNSDQPVGISAPCEGFVSESVTACDLVSFPPYSFSLCPGAILGHTDQGNRRTPPELRACNHFSSAIPHIADDIRKLVLRKRRLIPRIPLPQPGIKPCATLNKSLGISFLEPQRKKTSRKPPILLNSTPELPQLVQTWRQYSGYGVCFQVFRDISQSIREFPI